MKKYLIITPLLFLLMISCKHNTTQKQTKSNQPIAKIDTIQYGKFGSKGSSITIKSKIDSNLTEYHIREWSTKNIIDIRDFYIDNNKNIRFLHCRLFYSNEYNIAYSWDDKWGQTILSIDSIFTKAGKFKGIQITIGKEKKEGANWYDYLIWKEYSYKKETEFKISDCDRNIKFMEQSDKYYEMETDVPVKYAEWTGSSKSEFGHVYSRAFKMFKIAMLRIENKYLDIAKDKYGFDLLNYSF
jgi:hypothetical protein